jgi:hypothetical protein
MNVLTIGFRKVTLHPSELLNTMRLTMQRLINVLGVAGFILSATTVGAGVAVYVQRDAIVEGVKAKVTQAAIDGVGNALPGLLDSAMPALPETTGPIAPPAVPMP